MVDSLERCTAKEIQDNSRNFTTLLALADGQVSVGTGSDDDLHDAGTHVEAGAESHVRILARPRGENEAVARADVRDGNLLVDIAAYHHCVGADHD